MIAPARAQYKIPLEWLICAPRPTFTTRQFQARIRRSAHLSWSAADTLRSEPWTAATARVAAVISSPHLGVFAVIAAGPGPRRGHVIYSGVFAVAAVTAAH